MDSTKSTFFSASALAFLCIVFTASASPVVVPGTAENVEGLAAGCSLDITIAYSNNKQIPMTDLPLGFKEFLSLQNLNDVAIEEVSRHKSLMRDIQFHHRPGHAAHDEDNEEEESEVFTAYLKLTSPSACASLPLAAALEPAAIAPALGVSAVHSVFAVPSAALPAAAETFPVTGTAAVLISDFEDGSYDRFAEITTESGEMFVVGGPDSNNAIDLAEWTALRSGDEVELIVEADKIGPSAGIVGKGMGLAYEHAVARHRVVTVTHRTPKKADKSTPLGSIALIAIRVKYTNFDPDSFCTEACVANNLWNGQYTVDGAYRDSSYGAISIPQSLGTIVTVSVNAASTSYSTCNDLAGISAAAEAALASQFPSIILSKFNTKVYLTPAICGIGIAYLGSTPGKAFVNSMYPDTIAHEVGHTFGMQHANRDPGDDNTVDEYYGDRSCIMGYSQVSLRGFNVMHRIDSGWIPTSAVLDLTDQCSTAAQTLTLAPVSQATTPGAIVALRAVRRNLGRYFVSFRNGDGYDGLQTSSYLNKVVIHYQISTSAQTQLVAILSVGGTWSQANGDFSVTFNSFSASGASIQYSYCRPTAFPSIAATLTCGSTISGTNVGAKNLAGYTSGDVVYQVAMQTGVKYTISTCGSTLDTVVRVFNDGMYSQLTYCDNCGGCSSNAYSAVISNFSPPSQGMYMIGVEGFNVASGSFVISLTCSGTPTAASPSPAASRSPSPTRAVPVPSKSPAPSSSRVAEVIAASSSRTPSHTPSHTVSPSRSPSHTRSHSRSPSHTPSHTRSPSHTPSHTRSPSRAVSHTRSPSHTPSHTRSRSHSPSHSPSHARTHSRSPSHTPSHTRSPSRVVSHTRSPSHTPSHTRSPSPSASRKVTTPTCGTYTTGTACTLNAQCASCACSQKKCR